LNVGLLSTVIPAASQNPIWLPQRLQKLAPDALAWPQLVQKAAAG
jgi:hypothetical protein